MSVKNICANDTFILDLHCLVLKSTNSSIMKRLFLLVITLLSFNYAAKAQIDTLFISDAFTTHVIFPSDLTYAHLSNPFLATGEIIQQNRNMFSIKARDVFDGMTNISVLESSGVMHTFILKYMANPKILIVDKRKKEKPNSEANPSDSTNVKASVSNNKKGKATGASVSTWKDGSAPLLTDVIKFDQKLFHIADKQYDLIALCEDISSHSDITFLTLSLHNKSGISYAIGDPSFIIESKKSGKRTVKYENTIFPKNRHGSLAAGPGEYKRMVFSFNKLTLSKAQVFKIYFYEQGGQRNLVLTLNTKDLNQARRTIE